MNTLILILVAVFVLGVLAVVAFSLFELSPFARHSEHVRDPLTGERRWESPRLD